MKRKALLKELRGQSRAELIERVRTSTEELMKLRFRKASGQLEKSHRMGELKRTVARAQTVLRQMQTKGA